jgi:hypothetical protein
MAIVPNFSVAQTVGQPSIVILTDTSTGADAAITQRRAFLRKADGTFKVPTGTSTAYVQWAYADASKSIDALDTDYGFDIVVQWLDVSNIVLYDKTIPSGLTLYNETYNYGLTRMFSANPLLINDDDFFGRMSTVRTVVDSGNQAISFAEDIFAAQQCYNYGSTIRINYP